MKKWLLVFFCGVLGGVSAQPVTPVLYQAPLSVYTQNFDGLPGSGTFSLQGKGPFSLGVAPISAAGLDGWQIIMLSGTGANAVFTPGTGSSTGNGVYSLGSSGSTDRALGSLSSGAGIYAFGLILTNQTGGPLNYCTVSFKAEQWRKGGSGSRNTWSFRYKTGLIAQIDAPNLLDEPGLNFSSSIYTTAAAALVGNQPENQQTVSYTLSGLNWKPGEQLLLRWDDADETGSDDIVALDNFSFIAGLQTGIPTVTSLAVSDVGTHTAEASGTVNDNYAATAVFFEYDTSAAFTHPQVRKGEPDSIPAGTGATTSRTHLSALLPGTRYFLRIRAVNGLGNVTGNVKDFSTAYDPPEITHLSLSVISTGTATISATVYAAPNDEVLERGVVWSTSPTPTLLHNKVTAGTGNGTFSKMLSGLPPGSRLYARIYTLSAAGTTYSEELSFATPTSIQSIQPVGALRTNANIVTFSGKCSETLAGLSAAHFTPVYTGVNGPAITSVSCNATLFTVTLHTGNGSGTLGLSFVSDSGLSIPVTNKPFTSSAIFVIDKQPPQVRRLRIPDTTMKIGDTVAVLLEVLPDTDLYKISAASVNGFALTQWTKRNDSVYVSYFLVGSGGKDVDAAAGIPCTVTATDVCGNTATFNAFIDQPHDAIDANRPFVRSVQNPARGIYKANDTLLFVYHFSERITLSGAGAPYIGLTVGTHNRTAAYAQGNQTDSLVFRYIIAADDLDTTGIRVAGNISQSNVQLKDLSGNNALTSFTTPLLPGDILVDAIAPVVSAVQVPVNQTYHSGDTLPFVFSFSKNLLLTLKNSVPVVKLMIGGRERDLVFVQQPTPKQLVFQYIIQPGELDKNGISVASSIVLNGSVLTDSIGNAAILSFKTSSLANIKIDAIAPVFSMAPVETISVCGTGDTCTISNAFTASDDEPGELVTWRIRKTPKRGSISLLSFTATSNGKNLVPAGILYRPEPNAQGQDTLVTELTDGINTTQKTILIDIQPRISHNQISGTQNVCEDKPPAVLAGNRATGNASPQYLWQSSADSIHYTPAAGTRNEADYLSATLKSSTWFRRVLTMGVCADTSAPVKITVMKRGFWTGAQNTSWHNPANWCGNTLPDASTTVYVYPDATYQPMVKDSAWCNDLVLAKGAHLTVSGVLAMEGNAIADDSSLHFQTGKLVLNGTTAQSIDGNQFEQNSLHELQIDNASGVTLQNKLVITGNMVLTRGTLQTNEQLHFAQSGTLGASPAGTSINGRATVEYSAHTKTPLWIGNPFHDDIHLQTIRIKTAGDSTQPLFSTSGAVPFLYYDPSVVNDSTGFEAGWKPYPSGTDENTWKKYAVIKWEPTGAADTTTTSTANPLVSLLRISGEVNMGDQEINLFNNNTVTYQVISNPYISNIDLSLVTRSKGIGNYFWTWNPGQDEQGGYTCYPFNNRFSLPSMGTFIVKTWGSENRLLFTEQVKTKDRYDTVPPIRPDDGFFAELRLETGAIYRDRLLVVATDSAWTGFDRNDAEKLLNPGVNFYTIAEDGKKLSADARPLNNESIIRLGLDATPGKWLTIRVAGARLPANNTLMLHDKQSDRWIALATDSTYSFSTDSSGLAHERFEIRTRKAKTDTLITRKNILMTLYPIPAKNTVLVKYTAPETGATSVRIFDLGGKPVRYVPLGLQKQGQVIIPVTGLASGIYIVELRCGNNVGTEKIIIQ